MTDGADNKGGRPAGHLVPNIVARLPTVPADSGRSPPIFLHSSFRTGSTWLWQKLREAPTTLAYYEIFNEVLETLTQAHARRTDFSVWPSKHPIASPYFLEFLPFIAAEGGIPGFDRGMGVEGIIPCCGPDSDLPMSQYAHVDKLISTAWSQHRIPVLSCSRTLGRARALHRAFGGQTIFLHRNLFHQWSSYCFLAENGNTSFIDSMCRTIFAAEQDPYIRGLTSWFGLEKDARATHETLFPVFVLLHLYLYSIAFDTADLIIDTTEIAADSTARRHVERDLSEMVGHPISLSDARSSCEPSSLDIDSPQEVKDTIEQFAKLIPATSMSPDALRFVDQAKEKALAEWDLCEFFTRRTRSILTRKIDEAAARAEEQRNDNARLGAEIERLAAETSEVSRLRDAEQAAHDEVVRRLTDERDALLQGLSTSEAARADLDRTVAELSAERETAIAKTTEADARRVVLERELAEAKADRERSLFHRVRQSVVRAIRRPSA